MEKLSSEPRIFYCLIREAFGSAGFGVTLIAGSRNFELMLNGTYKYLLTPRPSSSCYFVFKFLTLIVFFSC
jgi:hypothetical protein